MSVSETHSEPVPWRPIAERIAQVRKWAGLSQASFCRLLGVSQSFVSSVERLETKPSLEMILGVAERLPEVSLYWLVTGVGDMKRPVAHISQGHSADRPEKESAAPPSILDATRSIFAELYPLPDIELLKGALEGLGALATFAETVGSYRLDPTGLAIAVDMECRHALALTAKLLKDEPETVPDVPNAGAGWL